ncbi:MAG: hypothetical protein JKX85_16390 [Phycisphaeraceae bacterium]|nr:hypothetical protein [Phycisphaeraceae bacterium]
MLIGIVEVPVPDLVQRAEKLNMPVERLFAELVNRYVDHLLSKGITPILWGDMFLSTALGKPGHGVEGFEHDPRIQSNLAAFVTHASFKAKGKNPPSVLKSMNYIKNRDKIIMGDWEYGQADSRGYPSIDYFQKMGFKDVWGATWLGDKAIKGLSQYTASRGCGGIIATSWHVSFAPKVLHIFPSIIRNSAVYQHNPDYVAPAWPVLSSKLTTNGQTSLVSTQMQRGIFVTPFQTLKFQAKLDGSVKIQEAQLLIRDEQTNRYETVVMPLTWDVANQRLSGTLNWPKDAPPLAEFYCTVLRLVCGDNGYLLEKRQTGDFYITSKMPQLPQQSAKTSSWLTLDFSNFSKAETDKNLFRSTGQFAQPLFVKQATPASATATADTPPQTHVGSLDCKTFKYAYAAVNRDLWKQVDQQGMRLSIRCWIDQKLSLDKPYFCSVLSWGTHRAGMRLLLARNKRLHLQFAMPGRGNLLTVQSLKPIPLKHWVDIQATLSPKVKGKKRVVSLKINNQKAVVMEMPNELLQRNGSLLTVASEFIGLEGRKNIWGNFPGQIQSIDLKPY